MSAVKNWLFSMVVISKNILQIVHKNHLFTNLSVN